MKKVIVKYNIPIKNNDFFVKKTLIELQELETKGYDYGQRQKYDNI